MTKTTWRSFTIPLENTIHDSGLPKTASKHLDFLTIELSKLLSNKNFLAIAQKHSQEHRGNYWTNVTRMSHKPHLLWTCGGQRAKYWRMLLERTRTTLDSLNERTIIAQTCANHQWDPKKENEIKQELNSKNIYPSRGKISNILKSKNIPTIPTTIPAFLDYTVGDKQVIETLGELEWKIEITGQWYYLKIPKPKHLRTATGKYSKPILQKQSNGNIIVRIAYEAQVNAIDNKANGIMGVDLGKIKPFAASVIYPDNSYSTELTFSRELKQLSKKIDKLNVEISRHYVKIFSIESLLKNKTDSYLERHLVDVKSNLVKVKRKRSLLKTHCCRVIARDVVAHAVERQVCLIKLEDLSWLESRGGKWDYSRVQSFIVELAELEGIGVVLIDAKNTSHSVPFSGDKITPRKDRSVVLEDGSIWDRDYLASLEIAVRPVRKVKKNCKNFVGSNNRSVIRQRSCRDKFGPTPKRPKTSSRRRVFLASNKKEFGASVIVASSGKDRRASHFSGLVKPTQAITSYTQVLQL